MKPNLRWIGILGATPLLPLAQAPASAAKPPMHIDVVVLVRDAKGAPLPGANITIDHPDPNETHKDKVKVPRSTGVTDERGIGVARGYFGWKDDRSGISRSEVDRYRVTVAKEGCKTFQGENGIYYLSSRSNNRYTAFLNDVRLETADSKEESKVLPLGLKPAASVNPPYGDSGTDFKLEVKLQVPEVLTAYLGATPGGKPLFQVAAMIGIQNPEKPDLLLADDGKAPDAAKNDGIFTAPLQPGTDPTQPEKLALVIRPQDDFHALIGEPGLHHTWVVTKSGMAGLGTFRRWNTVTATIVDAPIKWVVADDIEKARARYKEKFGDK